jgi:hypothetical protein
MMEIRNDKAGLVLETRALGFDHARVWPVAFSALEQVLGKDATKALCFHIFDRTGMAVGTLLMQDPGRFEETIASILQCDTDILLGSVCSILNSEFGLDGSQKSLTAIIQEVKTR